MKNARNGQKTTRKVAIQGTKEKMMGVRKHFYSVVFNFNNSFKNTKLYQIN